MAKQNVKQPESATAYKARLRRTALGLPEALVTKAVLSMKMRIQAEYEAKGEDIAADRRRLANVGLACAVCFVERGSAQGRM